MVLAGPRPNNEEDVDFFEQLAGDVGQGSDGLLQNFEEGVVGLGQALLGDQTWMQEKVPNSEIAASHPEKVVYGILEERKASSLHETTADKTADAGIPCDAASKEGDLQDHASPQDFTLDAPDNLDPHNHTVENAGLELSTDSSQSNLAVHGSSQPVVKELQWSIFSETYTPNEGPNALNDFLLELDAGTEDLNLGKQPALQVGLSDTAPNSNLLSQWKVENGNLADQNIIKTPFHSGKHTGGSSQLGGHGLHSQSSTHPFQLESNSYNGTTEQPLGEPSLEQGGNVIGFTVDSTVGNHNTGMHLQGDQDVFNEQNQGTLKQQSQLLSSESSGQYSSWGDAQLGGSYTSNGSVEAYQQVNSSHQHAYPSQTWESMYPGWYFDYPTSEWKQIEGWNYTGVTAGSDNYSTSSATNATLFQSDLDQGVDASRAVFNQGQNFTSGYNEAANVSGSVVQEQAALTGSVFPTTKEKTLPTPSGSLLEGEYTNLSAGYGNFDGASQSQMQVAWEEQYPGWYFDYQAQQWRQTTAEAFVHSHDSNVERSEPVKSDQQLNTNQSVDWPEESRSAYGIGVSTAYTSNQNLSFHGWEAHAVTTNFSDPVSGKTELVKEAFQFESNASMYGVQSYANGDATHHCKESEIPGNNLYISQHYNLPCNFLGSSTETKFSSDERPSHALVAFGFGGRLVTMKASSSSIPETIVLHDLNQLVQTTENSGRNDGVSYFSFLNRGGLAGPLVGGGLATKEVLKWIDDRVANCEVEDPQCTESLRLLWSVLRIACVHYGKLRPTHGSTSLKTMSEDGPEHDLGRLLSTSHRSPQIQGITTTSTGLQYMTPEPQFQSIALEMRKRLVDGKRNEALQLAQQGQLWGPAFVLASHLGEKAYAETVLQMAQQQFVPGCPLRTLFLLLGGQTTELFSTMSLPSPVGAAIPMKDSAGGMLGDWMGNLSIIAANPTNGDEQVITHLGDCLWKDHGEVAGAHTCYLIADTTFESFSEKARLCLVGADHFKWQRTFATPLSIQRTELYEYAKALGNLQFIVSPFQPYKLLYAYMLVEAGKTSEARRYCQAVTKALKNGVRTSEIEFCRQAASALEERLRLHSQGGYNLNSATGKFVGKFIGTLDSTLHRIIGGVPPRQASEPSLNKNPRDWYSNDKKVAYPGSKGREASMLDPSVQNGSLGKLVNRQMEAPSRSISEPNLSWTPEKKEQTTHSEHDGTAPKENKSEMLRTGYLGRLLSTAVGFMKSTTKKAELGEKNKFYYNKELKKWVEEGAEQTLEETVLLPPPITASFESNSGKASFNTEGPDAPSGSMSASSQMPPLPPSANQYSARGRLNGVRSRYVDTFNKGGTLAAKSTDTPLVSTSEWAMVPPPTQFFMPVQTETSTNNSTKASDTQLLDFSSSWSAGSSAAGNGLENEAVLPSDSSSSFTAVSPMDKHVSVKSMTGLDNNIIASMKGAGGFVSETTQFSSLSLARGNAWTGEVPSFYPTDTSMDFTQSSHLPNVSNAESGKNLFSMKLDGYMQSAKYPLPGPPVIESRNSSVGVESGSFDKSVERTESELHSGGIFTDMQEVEL